GTVGQVSPAQRVTVKNTGTAALTISAAPAISGANAGDFAVEGSTTCTNGANVAPDNSCVIDVTFKATAPDGRSAALVIKDNDSSSPQSVTLQGTAAAPAAPLASFAPNSLTFPGQAVGTTSSSLSITLTNSGKATLNISASPAIGGANGSDFAIA